MQMKSRLQRWGNKRAVVACADPLYQWVREGDKKLRLECVRNLALDPSEPLPEGELPTVKEIVTECHSKVVEFLLDFSRGKVLPGEKNKKGDIILQRQRPYTELISKETNNFKDAPPSWFGITLAALYPFLAADKTAWETLKTTVAHPCTSLWPVKVVKRFCHFIDTFVELHQVVLHNYEKAGGIYHDNNTNSEEDADKASEEETEGDEESEDCDDVFS